MRKPLPSHSTGTVRNGVGTVEAPPEDEFALFELALSEPSDPPPPVLHPERRPADRIKEALLRWLEEEM